MWLTIFVTACASFSDYLPQGPALGSEELSVFSAESFEEPKEFHDVLVLPLQVFGLRYDRDLVLETTHPTVSMLEVASIHLPEGEVWIAKIAHRDGTQTLVSDHRDVLSLLPEVDAPRLHQPTDFFVHEGSDGTLSVRLRLPDGELLEATATLRPLKAPRRTNSSTFNHSERIAMAVLEVSGKRVGLRASLSIGQHPQAFRRVLGLVPVKALLEQTQGGVVTADVAVSQQEGVVHLQRPESWAVPGTQTCEGLPREIRCSNGLGTTHYRFIQGGFSSAEVLDIHNKHLFSIQLDRPLPPITPALQGIHQRRFVVHVGGIEGAGHGQLVLGGEPGMSRLTLRPEAPRWLAERPMESRIQFHPDGSYRLETVRIQKDH